MDIIRYENQNHLRIGSLKFKVGICKEREVFPRIMYVILLHHYTFYRLHFYRWVMK